MQQENTSDALQHTPSFEQMVSLIEKMFKDYLKDIGKNLLTAEEIEKGWQRYKILNHLYQDVSQPNEQPAVEQIEEQLLVYTPCTEDDPRCCGGFTSNDGQRLCYVRELHVPHPEQVSDDAHEKEIMMRAFDKVRQIFESRAWIMEGRGSYPYNDDRYKEEVRYMYNDFDQLFKDTWANIKSKSVEYRKAIIAEYLKGEQKENEAVAFAEWLNKNYISIEKKEDKSIYVEYGPQEYHRKQQFSIEQLYNEYQKQKK